MPPKKDPKKDTKGKSQQKKMPSSGGGKAKKKKWSKGKVRDKLANACLFDRDLYDKFYKEIPTGKVITISSCSERLKIRGSLAKAALAEMHAKNLIKLISHHSSQIIYTRVPKGDDEAVKS